MKNIYLDYNATTPIHPEVKKVLIESFDLYGNPSSLHTPGRSAGSKIAEARSSIAKLINADPEEIIFTAGGSESNNTVLKYIVCNPASGCEKSCCSLGGRNEIITSVIEHPSIISTMDFIKSQGGSVVLLDVDKYGKVDLNQLEEKISGKTALVSVMMANNEIGTIQNIRKILKLPEQAGRLCIQMLFRR